MKCCLFCTCVVLSSVPQLESEPEVSQIGEVSEDVPFAIPKKWKWVRVSDVSHINPKVTAQTSNTEVSFIPMAALSAGYVNQIALDTTRLWGAVKNGYTKFADGDILLAKITPCFQNRKSAIARKLSNGIGCGSSEFHILRVSENIVTQEYLLMFLKSQWFITYGVENFKGTAGQQRLGTSELKNCLFSLPPLSEQHRIVAKVNQLFNLIDCTENAYNELSGPLSERFRQLCLEKAIQGKLVPQLGTNSPRIAFSRIFCRKISKFIFELLAKVSKSRIQHLQLLLHPIQKLIHVEHFDFGFFFLQPAR